jgi:amino acid transporter
MKNKGEYIWKSHLFVLYLHFINLKTIVIMQINLLLLVFSIMFVISLITVVINYFKFRKKQKFFKAIFGTNFFSSFCVIYTYMVLALIGLVLLIYFMVILSDINITLF